jgi:hypothetical protein
MLRRWTPHADLRQLKHALQCLEMTARFPVSRFPIERISHCLACSPIDVNRRFMSATLPRSGPDYSWGWARRQPSGPVTSRSDQLAAVSGKPGSSGSGSRRTGIAKPSSGRGDGSNPICVSECAGQFGRTWRRRYHGHRRHRVRALESSADYLANPALTILLGANLRLSFGASLWLRFSREEVVRSELRSPPRCSCKTRRLHAAIRALASRAI